VDSRTRSLWDFLNVRVAAGAFTFGKGTPLANPGSRQQRRSSHASTQEEDAAQGIFREMKRRKAYEKPSERQVREKAEAVRRIRKLARKQAQREGLIAKPKPKLSRTRSPAGK
jgi:hypothetical protein